MNDIVYCIPLVVAAVLIFLAVAIYQSMPRVGIPPGNPTFGDDKRLEHPVIRAMIILEQRKYNRWIGPNLCPDWTPGECFEVDCAAMWITRQDKKYGVTVNCVGDIQDSLSKGELR